MDKSSVALPRCVKIDGNGLEAVNARPAQVTEYFYIVWSNHGETLDGSPLFYQWFHEPNFRTRPQCFS